MLKKLHFKTMLLLALMLLGASSTWADQVTVSMTTFTTISGNVGGDANISYAAAKGTAATTPAVNSNQIRVYQNGGTFTVSANNGAKINSVTLGSAMTTTVTYSVDGGTASSNQSITAGNTITVSNLDCSTVLFTCKGTTSSARLYVNNLSVTYSPAPKVNVTGVSLNKKSTTLEVGKSETLTASVFPDNATNKTVTWESSDEAIATVANGVVSAVSVGSTTITVTTQDGSYSANCNVTVTAPDYLFYESFDKCSGTGGNDALWSGSIASATMNADNIGWTFNTEKAAYKCGKFGSQSGKGSAQTPALGHAGNLVVSFKAAAWNGSSESTTLNLSVSDGGSLSSTSVTMVKGAWTEYEIVIYGATAETKLKFEGTAAKDARFFLDEVIVYEGLKRSVTSAGYATLCAPYALSFEGLDVAAFKATEVTSGVEFEAVTEVPAGAGVLLKADEGSYMIPVIASASALSDNKFVGVAEDGETINAADGNFYVLRNAASGIGFYHVTATAYNLKKGTAYLSLDNALAKGFIGFGDETAIESVATLPLQGEAYNLQGQKVSAAYKGVVIVNGKKFINK